MNKVTIFIPKFADQDEYKKFYELADDKDRLNATLFEYEISAGKIINEMIKENFLVHRDYISISDLISWLRENGFKNIGKNRSEYFAHIAKSKFSE